jgi:four helix bundle protein
MRSPARSFEDLIVWQKAHRYVLSIYRLTNHFPKHEIFSLTAQMRRASISIPANIAEGFKKRGKADKVRFLNIAQGSVEECQYYLIVARDLKYGGDIEPIRISLKEVSKLLEGYMKAIERGIRPPSFRPPRSLPLTFPPPQVPFSPSNAPVAQLDRASDYGSEGCVFESRRVQVLEYEAFTT